MTISTPSVPIDRKTISLIAMAKQKANDGIEYSRRFGAVCPVCGAQKIKTIRSDPWRDGVKIRYHRCMNSHCIAAVMSIIIKSIELE